MSGRFCGATCKKYFILFSHYKFNLSGLLVLVIDDGKFGSQIQLQKIVSYYILLTFAEMPLRSYVDI